MSSNPLSYYSYDLLTGRFLGQLPLRGVQFGSQLNAPGQLSGTLDLRDPRLANVNATACTTPNRTLLVVDYNGAIVWAGIVMTRRWAVESTLTDTSGLLQVQASETWCYFAQRIQATDYSAPPTSGIGSMSLWTADVWDASLIACQVIEDAIGYADSSTITNGNLLGGMSVLLNGATPSAGSPAAPSGDWINVTFPFTSTQTVDTIVQQLSQLGLGVGFDFAVDIAYTSGPGSAPVATINLSYPRRGRTVAQNHFAIDLTTARNYEFPEDGTQTANQVYEQGGSGALVVSENVFPLNQGYPLWERVMSRATAQSQNIISLLAQIGISDLAMYSYATVVPTVTLSMFDANLPIGSFLVGDDIRLMLPPLANDGATSDPRFPAGLDQEWRIVQYDCNVADEGDATMTLTLNIPPVLVQTVPPV